MARVTRSPRRRGAGGGLILNPYCGCSRDEQIIAALGSDLNHFGGDPALARACSFLQHQRGATGSPVTPELLAEARAALDAGELDYLG